MLFSPTWFAVLIFTSGFLNKTVYTFKSKRNTEQKCYLVIEQQEAMTVKERAPTVNVTL